MTRAFENEIIIIIVSPGIHGGGVFRGTVLSARS